MLKNFEGLLVIICICISHGASGLDITSNQDGAWSSTTSWVGGIVPDSDDSVTIAATHDITLTADASCIHLTIMNGTLTISGNYQFTISGTLTLGGSATLTSDDQSQFWITDFDGSQPRLYIPDGVVYLRQLSLDRAAGVSSDHDIYLDNNVPSVGYNALILTNGILYMSSIVGNDILYMKSNDIAKGIPCGDANHLDGRMSRLIEKTADTSWHTFPLGDSGHSRRVDVSSTSNGANRESVIEFFWKSYWTTDHDATLNGGLLDKYYWEHNKINLAGPEPNVSRRFYYNAVEDFAPGFNINELRMATFNSGPAKWSAITTGVSACNSCMYQNNDNSSNNIPWTWGGTGPTMIILPIELLEFNAFLKGDNVEVFWTTASEINNDYFTIERSVNGLNFKEISKVDGAGTSYEPISYSTYDNDPLEGISYYRLKQTDYDGNYQYSDIIAVNNNAASSNCELYIYPNPCEHQCKIKVTGCDDKDFYHLNFYDIMGNRILYEVSVDEANEYFKDPHNKLTPGVYIFEGIAKHRKVYRKFIAQ